ncbi:hypothetical protein D9758_010534 [Tetrapyrgos nigripes]|uniref:Uncharacterized protein n=1 Tax=Tetrapyrgos nigripes TaxID=182062 RepID=A0A8H5FW26_9AGAR|nr:hypothetical protein D9758_010534 [Tetrapyrgos nigripes]
MKFSTMKTIKNIQKLLAEDNADKKFVIRGSEVGLPNIARYVETDEQRKLVFIANDGKIKSYDWSGLRHPPVATLTPCPNIPPLLMLPNGRLARAGTGKVVAVWALDGLQTHGPDERDIVGKREKRDEQRVTDRDDFEDVERSSGSPPSQVIPFSFDPALELDNWALHPGIGLLVHMCPGIDAFEEIRDGNGRFGGRRKEVGRFLGHGATVTRITTGVGWDQGPGGHVFCTGCADGMARIYDVRQRLPVLTVEGDSREGACRAVLAYPDGIPVIFTGAMRRTQCIRVWDARAKAAVYELATGNNAVDDLAWDGLRNTLYAATSCPEMDRIGYTHDYRRARIPKAQLGKFRFPNLQDGCWVEGDYDPDEMGEEGETPEDDDDGKS